MTSIHPTAIIEVGAKIGQEVVIGPYCQVGSNVELGDKVQLISHVIVTGHTRIGAGTKIYPFATIGFPPQFLAYGGEPSEIHIGANTTIREHVTINPGTQKGGMLTSVGNSCFLMVASHIGHDCHVGNNVIMANNATLGGHCKIGDYAYLGGLTAIHQWVRVGQHAIVGGMSGVENDVIPYGSVLGNRAHLSGLNIVGLKRRGFSREEIHTLRNVYRLLFANEGTLAERIEDVANLFPHSSAVMDIITFMKEESSRALCVPKG
jgi:UDP-N-acetylglucosamine acyltransferase